MKSSNVIVDEERMKLIAIREDDASWCELEKIKKLLRDNKDKKSIKRALDSAGLGIGV